jgi:hypothetical protein
LVESGAFSVRADCDLTNNCSNQGSECSAGLEEEDSNLTEVEVDEVLGLVGYIRAEVTADNAMPGGVVLFVEFLLDECGNILLNVELLESLSGDVDSVLLHIFGHVCVLHNGLAVCHN